MTNARRKKDPERFPPRPERLLPVAALSLGLPRPRTAPGSDGTWAPAACRLLSRGGAAPAGRPRARPVGLGWARPAAVAGRSAERRPAAGLLGWAGLGW